MSEGEVTGDSFVVACNAHELLHVVSDGAGSGRLFSVVIVSPEVRGEGPLRVGARVSSLLKRNDVNPCMRGREETQETVFCSLKGAPNVSYAFDIDETENLRVGVFGSFRPGPAGTRTIHEIIWNPR
jgi:Protein of unknown function (DUF1131)